LRAGGPPLRPVEAPRFGAAHPSHDGDRAGSPPSRGAFPLPAMPKPPTRCPHGAPIFPHERLPFAACAYCQDEIDMVLEQLRWGERP
jgi:hypothetical protein